ncbi:MAG: hypothetical protein SF162_12410 [bacterium]|nr:hypothetical protein [bacterium]
MVGRLFGGRASVPNLVIAQRVIDKMAAAAASYLEDETGEAMVGVVVPNPHSGVATVYVLETIAPDASAIRHQHTFQQGDERQDEMLYWWRENWRVYRATLSPDKPLDYKWNVPLHHIGDWHKQPGFMIQPSGGDLMTALEWLGAPENKLDFMLAPILTLGHPPSTDSNGMGHAYLLIPSGDAQMRVDWWYIDLKTRGFLPITPTVYPDASLPALPAPPWHLADEKRFDLECRRLRDHGLFLSLTLWDADSAPPLEVCLLVAHAAWEHLLLVVTPHDYPAHPPRARIAPFIPMDGDDDLYAVFEQAWAQSQPLDPAPETWDADRWLVDYVGALAAAHGLAFTPAAAVEIVTDAPAPPGQAALDALTTAPAVSATPPSGERTSLPSEAAPPGEAAPQPQKDERDV